MKRAINIPNLGLKDQIFDLITYFDVREQLWINVVRLSGWRHLNNSGMLIMISDIVNKISNKDYYLIEFTEKYELNSIVICSSISDFVSVRTCHMSQSTGHITHSTGYINLSIPRTIPSENISLLSHINYYGEDLIIDVDDSGKILGIEFIDHNEE